MSYVTDTMKQPLDIMAHSDPGSEFVSGNDVSLNPDRNFRSGLAASYSDDRIAQSAGISQDDYMHTGEIAAALAAVFFGAGALGAGTGGGGAGAEAGVAGDAGAATAGGGVAEGGVGTVVGEAGADATVTGATGASLVGDVGSTGLASTGGVGDAAAVTAEGGGAATAAAGGGGDAGAATASGGASSGGTGGSASTSGSLSSYAHKAATYMSLYNTAAGLLNANKAQGANTAGAAPPLKYQDPNAPDLTAIRKKNSLLFGDDSPASTDLTKGKASTGNLGKAVLLGS